MKQHCCKNGQRSAGPPSYRSIIWIIGTVILTIGVGLIHTGHDIGDPIAAVAFPTERQLFLACSGLALERDPYRMNRVAADC